MSQSGRDNYAPGGGEFWMKAMRAPTLMLQFDLEPEAAIEGIPQDPGRRGGSRALLRGFTCLGSCGVPRDSLQPHWGTPCILANFHLLVIRISVAAIEPDTGVIVAADNGFARIAIGKLGGR